MHPEQVIWNETFDGIKKHVTVRTALPDGALT